tara:strand:- start:960 stop:1376 length:417 start_codon:yes stop_codon:yes gene_type:complete
MACQNSNYKDVEYPFQKIEENVTKIINDSVKKIDINNLTPFKWSELYLFKPYTSVESIDDSLGFVWEGAKKTFINQEGDFHLLVFTENNEVINYIKWPINKGDFMRVENLKYSYDSAKFIFRKEKYGGRDKVFIYEKK